MKLGLGTASFGTSIVEKQAHAIIDVFVSAGGTIIDSANNYAFWAGKGGESEKVIGSWLKGKQRDSVKIHTKIGAQPLDGVSFESAEGLSKQAINCAFNASMKRLSTNYVDVLYAHIDDPATPLLETWSTLSDLVKKGVVKQLGVSNYPLARIIELQKVINDYNLEPISYAQYRHTVIDPIEGADMGVQLCFTDELIARLKSSNVDIKLVAYSPLLKGGFELGNRLPENYDSFSNQDVVNEIQIDAKTLVASPSALVLKKISDSGIIPLTMTGKIKRLKENMQLF